MGGAIEVRGDRQIACMVCRVWFDHVVVFSWGDDARQHGYMQVCRKCIHAGLGKLDAKLAESASDNAKTIVELRALIKPTCYNCAVGLMPAPEPREAHGDVWMHGSADPCCAYALYERIRDLNGSKPEETAE